MNKVTLLAFFSISFCGSLSAYNWQQHVPDWQQFIPNHNGNNHHENVSDTSDTYYGPVSKTGYHAQGLTVYGPLSLTNSRIDGELTVFGPVTLEKTVVEGTITLYGIMSIANSSVNNIDAWTTQVRIKNSTAQNIFIGQNGQYDHQQTQKVFLSGTTNITGTITFEQGNGIVIVAPNAEFNGRVIGGKVKKK